MITPAFIIKAAAATAAGVISFVFGAAWPMIPILIVVVVIDYVTGIVSAAINKKLNSSKGFSGILKKIFIFLIVATAALIDRAVPTANSAISAAVCAFYIANEALSILENAGEAGLPLPKILKSAIEKLKTSD